MPGEREEAIREAEAVPLTRYAVTTRYPGEEDLVSRQEAREAAGLAARVLAWAETPPCW